MRFFFAIFKSYSDFLALFLAIFTKSFALFRFRHLETLHTTNLRTDKTPKCRIRQVKTWWFCTNWPELKIIQIRLHFPSNWKRILEWQTYNMSMTLTNQCRIKVGNDQDSLFPIQTRFFKNHNKAIRFDFM